jgi:type I restriction enzyme S subunit
VHPDLLLDRFDRIAEAPEAVPRLRRFILDLAVRGKLVEQDPTDEPAAELLKRIAAEKVRLLQTGEIPRACGASSNKMALLRFLWVEGFSPDPPAPM